MKLVSILLCALLLAGAPASVDRQASFDSLVQAERAFCQAVKDKGIRAAFLQNLAKDSIVFQPGPVDGYHAYEQRPDSGGTLSWAPVFGDVSAAGDLGYTTGPWEFAKDEKKSFGHYLSVWQKQDDVWKLVLDAGVGHSEQIEPTEPRVAASTGKSSGESGAAANVGMLYDLDKRLAKNAAKQGLAAAYGATTADEVVLLRQGKVPSFGKENMAQALEKPGVVVFTPIGGRVARSNDLGYTYGNASVRNNKKAPKLGYCHIWKKGPAGWRLAVERIG